MRKENKIFCLLVVKAPFKVYVPRVIHFIYIYLFDQGSIRIKFLKKKQTFFYIPVGK